MKKRLALAAALALSALSLAPSPASADAVMPPPDSCPRGETGITDHGGPRCVKEAPTDCPSGWRGVLGGTCRLTPCADDAGCGAGEACVEHSVCLQPFEDGFYDYGEEEAEKKQGAAVDQVGNMLAAPMMPRKPRPTPITRYHATNLCAPEIACAAPSTCQPEKICAPKGSRALAYRGANISPARVARKTASPLTASAAEPREAPAVLPPPRTGCGGCATSTAPAGAGLVAATATLVTALFRRRRRPSR